MPTHRATKYWLFLARPRLLDIREALRKDSLRTFPVRTHAKSIRQGDRVIIWKPGQKGGCYGLAEVSTVVYEAQPEAGEAKTYTNLKAEARVGIRMVSNLWDRPLSGSEAKMIVALQELTKDTPGINRRAQWEQYQAIEEWISRQNTLAEPLVDYETPPLLRPPQNTLFYGPPGTGKTFQTVTYALSIIEHKKLSELEQEDRQQLRQRYDQYRQEGRLDFVTFHPGFSYEDFVEGFKPLSKEGQIAYELKDGILKALAKRAREALLKHLNVQQAGQLPSQREEDLNQAPRFVLIIDELNRGDVAAIFGELITLLEDDKREGRREVLLATLPYSRDLFSLPANLYIIATMNTVDRHTQQLDLALRRRFTFKEMPPDPHILAQHARSPKPAGVDLSLLLEAINNRLLTELGPDFRIGHAYFLGIENLDDLRAIFARHILPLLGEYFYHDYHKIAEVLHPNFLTKADQVPTKIRDVASLSEADFILVYEGLSPVA